MRRALGTILSMVLLAGPLTGLLVGCGSEESASDPATDPATGPTSSVTSPAPSGSPSEPPADGPVEFATVELISQTAAGGRVSEQPTVLADASDVADFAAQFKAGRLGSDIADAVERAAVPEGRVLVGAVVALGCDVPPGVRVQVEGGALTITALPVKSPLQECFAAVTTVALVTVDAGLV